MITNYEIVSFEIEDYPNVNFRVYPFDEFLQIVDANINV